MCSSGSVDENPQMFSHTTTYVSEYLPVKWDGEKFYASVTQDLI